MIIKLCGSDRFKETFDFFQKRLEDSGHTVYGLSDLGTKTKLSKVQEEEAKKLLVQIGLFKVGLCDAIVIINENGYIGADTAIESYKAKIHSKKIYYFDAADLQSDWRHLLAPMSVAPQAHLFLTRNTKQ